MTSGMTSSLATAQASPSWRAMAVLVALVTAAHALILQTAPASLGLRLTPEAANKAFATRRIDAPIATTPLAAKPEKTANATKTALSPPKPASTPKIKSNQPPAQQVQEQPAIDLIANQSISSPFESTTESPAASMSPSPTATVANTAPTASQSSTVALAPTSTPATSTTSANTPATPKPTLVTAINLPGSARLQYKMTGTSKGLTYYANADLTWSNSGSQYEAGMKVSALFVGSRSMSSVGRVTSSGLAPTRFADKFRSELAAHFDADKGKITFSANTPDATWVEGAQDRVSVFMQLAGMLAAGPAATNGQNGQNGLGGFPVGSSITIYTVGPREADTWTFVVEAEEKLTLPYGEMSAFKLTRKPRREYDQKVEIWYAPSLGFLPVRNRITQQNGDFIDQMLETVTKP
ncbi:MAG: DUF3108 domain-containing protein [Polaromonas sp.]|nr:DUF3108 domain-containing protein [Polaromonas sp.]